MEGSKGMTLSSHRVLVRQEDGVSEAYSVVFGYGQLGFMLLLCFINCPLFNRLTVATVKSKVSINEKNGIRFIKNPINCQ